MNTSSCFTSPEIFFNPFILTVSFLLNNTNLYSSFSPIESKYASRSAIASLTSSCPPIGKGIWNPSSWRPSHHSIDHHLNQRYKIGNTSVSSHNKSKDACLHPQHSKNLRNIPFNTHRWSWMVPLYKVCFMCPHLYPAQLICNLPVYPQFCKSCS